MNAKIRYTFLLLSLLCYITVRGQEHSAASAVRDAARRVLAYNQTRPQEKVYLHFDNTGYFIGETLRFKAYVVSTDSGRLSRLSHVLYVELLNPGGEVIARRKVMLEEGQGHGDIALEQVFSPGFYEVRAYTRYMTNWGTDACFSRVFPFFRKPEKEGDYTNLDLTPATNRTIIADVRKEDSIYTDKLNVSFYPEGGHLVRGLKSRVAFLVTDQRGHPIETDVLLTNPQREVVATVRADSDGRGVVAFTPDGGTFTLCVPRKAGRPMKEIPLPVARPTGAAMRVDAVSDTGRIWVQVACTPDMLGTTLGLGLMHEGRLLAWPSFTADTATHTLAFRRRDLPEGVNQLTLFDEEGRIWAERLCFVMPTDRPEERIRISTSNHSLTPCGKVSLDFKTVPNATFSLAAMDAQTLPNGMETTARTWMLLSSDLRGYIAHPQSYLERDDSAHRAAADRLMMVQGWRKYDWQVMSATAPPQPQELVENQLNICGRAIPTRKKRKAEGVEISAVMYDREGRSYEGTFRTDTSGRYTFFLPDLYGDWQLYLSTRRGRKEENLRISIDRNFDLPARRLCWGETRRLPSPEQNLFPHGWAIDTVATDSARLIMPGGMLLPDVKIKGRRILGNPDRPAWKEESFGKRYAGIYYDMDAAAERIQDRGEQLPTLMEWLPQHNPSFNGNASMFYTQLEACADTMPTKETDFTESTAQDGMHMEEVPMNGIVNPKFRILNTGLGYNNNPIIWIVDNSYFCTTRFPMGDYRRGRHGVTTTDSEWVGDFYRDGDKKGSYFLNEPRFSVAQKFPMFLDEVKSVYITSAPSAYRAFIITNPMTWDAFDPVTVFVYTHHEFWSRKATGQRRTRFHGFNRATTFQTNDYSLMPPLPNDFRRTLYWNPDVHTDSSGHAHVEFYNNSTCTSVFLSAEGITQEGRAVTNEP